MKLARPRPFFYAQCLWHKAGNEATKLSARAKLNSLTNEVQRGTLKHGMMGVQRRCREHRAMGGWVRRIPRSVGHGIARSRTGLSMGRMQADGRLRLMSGARRG